MYASFAPYYFSNCACVCHHSTPPFSSAFSTIPQCGVLHINIKNLSYIISSFIEDITLQYVCPCLTPYQGHHCHKLLHVLCVIQFIYTYVSSCTKQPPPPPRDTNVEPLRLCILQNTHICCHQFTSNNTQSLCTPLTPCLILCTNIHYI